MRNNLWRDLREVLTFIIWSVIFAGKQSQKDGKGKVLNVYAKDNWIVLVDEPAKNVVTLYKIDLGLDEDFNKSYVKKMLEKINQVQQRLENTQVELLAENQGYKELIDEVDIQISEYKSMINNLETLRAGYKQVIEGNSVKVEQAKRDVADVVNQLIGKREF